MSLDKTIKNGWQICYLIVQSLYYNFVEVQQLLVTVLCHTRMIIKIFNLRRFVIALFTPWSSVVLPITDEATTSSKHTGLLNIFLLASDSLLIRNEQVQKRFNFYTKINQETLH